MPENDIGSSHAPPTGKGAVVVIAAYCEAANLGSLLPKIFECAPAAKVVVVDDNSPDGTADLLASMVGDHPQLVALVRSGKLGYGTAVLDGMRRALDLGAECVVTLDADFSHDPQDIPRLIEALHEGDVAIGSRYIGGVRVLNWGPGRLVLSLFANRYVAAVLGLRSADNTSGFRAYRRDAIERLLESPPRSVGYSFLVEILFSLHRAGKAIVEVPIIYTERREGQSKMSKTVILEAVVRPWILLATRGRGRGGTVSAGTAGTTAP